MNNLAFSLLLASVPPLPAAQAVSTAPAAAVSTAAAKPASVGVSTAALREAVLADRRVRGIHLTSWGAGGAKSRRDLIHKISGTVLNTVVIAVKETDGKVYIPGVETAHRIGSYEGAIQDPEKMVADFKAAGQYTVARIVVFKDKVLPRKRPDLAVKNPSGDLWRSHNGAVWADMYSREVWDYNLEVALRAVKAGFDEIQFDYIRYPSEGNTKLCRYSKPHNMKTAMSNLGEFLRYARKKIPAEVKISADVFGLTTSSDDDMGIGQDIRVLAENADYVYPMMYPSHYYPGQYGLKHPNAQPYRVINRGLKDAAARLGLNFAKVRPYLQDFSLGPPAYGPAEVRAQLIATRMNLLESWVLWNPANRYNWPALTPQSYRSFVDPSYE